MSFKIVVKAEDVKADKLPGPMTEQFFKAADLYFRTALRDDLMRKFKNTTKNWEAPPQFKGTVSYPQKGQLQLWVRPEGPNTAKWQRVSGGTPPHTIRARKKRALAFKTGYTPHTRPGGLYGGSGTRFGDAVFSHSVEHPGIEPREFSKNIAAAKAWDRQVSTALRTILRGLK